MKIFKVIEIIDEYNIVVGAGTDDGICLDDIFEVFEKGKEITFDNVSYGTLDNIKAELEIKTLYPKMCLCQSTKVIRETIQVEEDENGNIISQVQPTQPTNSPTFKTIDKVAPLKVANTSAKFNYLKSSKIKLGDLVRICE